MFSSIFTGMSGLQAFSKGLDVISNNVANLNTPGYKGSELLFRDLFYRYELVGNGGEDSATAQLGNGVVSKDTTVRFEQGDVQQTGIETDAAIDGKGFFVLRDEGQTFYTRAGQFEFDDDGFLVARGSQARVAALDGADNLSDISIGGLRTSAASPTTILTFESNLSTGSDEHVVTGVEVIDSLGEIHTLSVKFTNNSENVLRSWLVEVSDENNQVITSDGEIRFNGSGSPQANFNEIKVDFNPGSADPMALTFSFGEPDGFDGATNFSAGTTSDLALKSSDGYGVGSILNIDFGSDGLLSLEYSNGQSAEFGHFALAWFDDLQSLRQGGNGFFSATDNQEAVLARPTDGIMGEIIASNIELSNVDLTQEFTDLIVVQRGFQASSQILTVSNEMLEQLLDLGRGS